MFTESSLQMALRLCVQLSPIIISMCFSMRTLTDETINLISTLSQSGVLLCASVDPVLFNSYPQSLQEVMSVDVQTNMPTIKDDIILVNDVFFINSQVYNQITDEVSSSFATGYFAGFLAKILEFNPLSTQSSIQSYYKQQSRVLDLPDIQKKQPLTILLQDNMK